LFSKYFAESAKIKKGPERKRNNNLSKGRHPVLAGVWELGWEILFFGEKIFPHLKAENSG